RADALRVLAPRGRGVVRVVAALVEKDACRKQRLRRLQAGAGAEPAREALAVRAGLITIRVRAEVEKEARRVADSAVGRAGVLGIVRQVVLTRAVSGRVGRAGRRALRERGALRQVARGVGVASRE